MGTPRMCPARPCSARWCFLRNPDPAGDLINERSLFLSQTFHIFVDLCQNQGKILYIQKSSGHLWNESHKIFLGFYHIGAWFSPTFASHKFHVPLAEKWCWVMGWSQVTPLLWPNHSGCRLPPIVLVLKSFFPLWFTPPSLSWDERLELKANLQTSEEIFGPWSSAYLVRIFWLSRLQPATSMATIHISLLRFQQTNLDI